MTRIKLCLRASEPFATVLNIYDVTSDRVKRENKPDLLLPPGDYLEIDLRPGKYIAELRLPAGNLLREEVEVRDQSPQYVDFYVDSPHEWLQLQRLVGNVKREPRTYTDYEKETGLKQMASKSVNFPKTWIVPSKSFFAGRNARDSSYFSERFGTDRSEIKEGYFFLHPELQRTIYPDEEGNLPPYVTDFSEQISPLPISPTRADNITHFFELDKGTTESYLSQEGREFRFFEYNDDNFQRAYLWTQIPGFPHQYSVLPIPWKRVYGNNINQETCVQVYINLEPMQVPESKNLDALHRISIAVNDDVMASLLGYLGSGDLPSAALILRKAKEFLMFKMINPFAAAAGAYVMLEQSELDQHFPWHDWIKNLMNWFKWLPDGAIQYAWLQLAKTNNRAPEVDIKKSLLEAYNRGLPYYSAGVKLLLNGLTIFNQRLKVSGRRDIEIEKALTNVRLLASHTDRRQPFTSVITDQ